MKLDYKKILENKSFLKIKNQIPKDLESKIHELGKVKRFQFDGYPNEVLKDDSKTHTLRCVYIAQKLGYNKKYKDITRTLWIHDVPEIISGDITVAQKLKDPDAFKKFEKRELEAAKKLLNESDQKLLKNFNEANRFLKGKPRNSNAIPSQKFIMAKIIDNSEGNMTFHYLISNWISSLKYDENLLPPSDSLDHTFKINETFVKNIKEKIPKTKQKEPLKLIKLILNNIKNFWAEVPENKIPQKIKKNIL